MHSMSALAANTTSPPAIGGWGLVVVAVVVLILIKKGRPAAGAPGQPGKTRSFFRALGQTLRTLGRAFRSLWTVVRFYGGYEMRGAPRSDATFLRAGTPRTQPTKTQPVEMASIAIAPPKVSLVKAKPRKPRAWARHTATWLTSYQGRAATALDKTIRVTLWCARWSMRTVRALRAAYRVTASVVVTVVRVLRAWHCWPYAARGLARIIATALLVAWLVPAWTGWAYLVALAATVPLALLTRSLVPQEPGDDAVYGPKIWAVLRTDLGLPEDEPREHWLKLPEQLGAAGARIAVRLPWTFRGSDLERTQLTDLLNSRLPGEWVGRFSFTGEHPHAIYTHKPPPKPPAPTPEPPAAVDIWDPKVQETLAALGPDDFYLGQDEFDRPVIQKMADEQAHWALSVGSGGGKSAMLHWLAIQMLMKRGTVVPIDPKMVSMTPLIGIKGVHSYVNPEAPYDMRRTLKWAAEVVKARNYEKKNRIRTAFEPLYLILEECNELADLLKEQYSADKESGDPAGDPIWRDAVAKILRLGREVNVHVIAVFQDFKDTQFGGVSLVPLFPFKIMGSYNERQWKRIIGTNVPMPTPQKKAGRMVLVLDSGDVSRIQVPYAPRDPEKTKDENQKAAYKRLTAYYNTLRATYGYSTDGLYTAPPEPSQEVAPTLLRQVSRDTGAQGQIGGLEGGPSDETAGHGVTHQGSVTPGVTGQRDRLRLIAGEAGAEGSQGPLEPPTLLTIAEAAREMQARGYVIEAGLIRTHKSRRDKGTNNGFPTGIVIDGTEKFTLAQLITFYEQRGIEKREESQEDSEQGDAV